MGRLRLGLVALHDLGDLVLLRLLWRLLRPFRRSLDDLRPRGRLRRVFDGGLRRRGRRGLRGRFGLRGGWGGGSGLGGAVGSWEAGRSGGAWGGVGGEGG